MGYWCIKKGLFFVVHPKSKMSQEIGSSRKGYLPSFIVRPNVPRDMSYWCIKKGLFFGVHPKPEMSQEIWAIGASRRGYFSLLTLNLRCPKRYGLLVHQEGAIFCCSP